MTRGRFILPPGVMYMYILNLYVCNCVCTCIYWYLYVYNCVRMYVRMYPGVYIYAWTRICVGIRMCVSMQGYLCICLSISISRPLMWKIQKSSLVLYLKICSIWPKFIILSNYLHFNYDVVLTYKIETGQTCLSWMPATSYAIAITRIGDDGIEIRLWQAYLNP